MELKYISVILGADPEFFFKKDGKIIGAEKVLPEGGLRLRDSFDQEYGNPMVIIDGVQAELNPPANTCRQSFSSGIINAFRLVDQVCKAKDVEVDFGVTHKIDEAELETLSPKNRELGCEPSLNAYGPAEVGVSGRTYPYRSAGGHIHLGIGDTRGEEILHEKAARTVMLLDIVVGNTCVLIDRDPGNIKRRETYGRAGEYRLPKHGLEYRTLSNFWLRDYRLLSLVMSLARMTVHIAGNEEATQMLLSLVDHKKVIEAINKNDFDLAKQNFDAICTFLSELTQFCSHCEYQTKVGGNDFCQPHYPLHGKRLTAFSHLVMNGIETYIKGNPVKNWKEETKEIGWERFCERIIQ